MSVIRFEVSTEVKTDIVSSALYLYVTQSAQEATVGIYWNRCPVRISSGTLTILIEVSHGFLVSLGIFQLSALNSGHYLFLPHLFQLIIHYYLKIQHYIVLLLTMSLKRLQINKDIM
jgi:hypothetical protein